MNKPATRMGFVAICALSALLGGVALQRTAEWANSPSDFPVYRQSVEVLQAPSRQLGRPSERKNISVKPCRDLQGVAASELCAQWRTVDAADRSASWAWWQMLFSFLGIFGLAVTLWFNHQAWRLAKTSEDGTREALEIAARNADAAHATARAYVAKERAYLGAHGAYYIQTPYLPIEDAFQIAISNYGQSPATIESIEWEYLDGPVWPEQIRFQSFDRLIIAAGENGQLPPLQADRLPGYDDPKWVVGTLHYRSLESVISQTHFCFRIELKPDDGYRSAHFETFDSICSGRPSDS